MRKWTAFVVLPIVAMLCMGNQGGCSDRPAPQSASGIKETKVKIEPGTDGLTTEQRNVRDRLVMDNKPGSIKHLYIISAYSGQVLIYSTVRGKVTSSGKRLTPTSVVVGASGDFRRPGFSVPQLGDVVTSEVLQDDGTYGNSIEYLFWFDARGAYHQQYVQGGMILHVSDQPQSVKSVVLNMEIASKTDDKTN
jgi:hypothetical protein